jgi:hypothetical protein
MSELLVIDDLRATGDLSDYSGIRHDWLKSDFEPSAELQFRN